MLFVPFRHVEDAAEEPYETARTVECASYHAKSQKQDFNLITSAGKAATQTVKHLHVHYIPRKEGDGLKLPWSDDA